MANQQGISEDFESWYHQWKSKSGHRPAGHRSTNRTAGMHGGPRRRHGNESNSSSSNNSSSASSIVENAVGTLIDAVNTVVSKHQRPRPSVKEETYRKMVRRLDLAERQLEKRRRNVVIFGGLSLASILTGEVGIIVLAFLFTGYKVYALTEHKRKIDHLAAECRRYEEMHIPDDKVQREKEVLRHAYNNNGRVYPERIALESDFSLSEVEHMLAICVDKHIASIELDENGRTYYYFTSLDNSDPYADLPPVK